VLHSSPVYIGYGKHTRDKRKAKSGPGWRVCDFGTVHFLQGLHIGLGREGCGHLGNQVDLIYSTGLAKMRFVADPALFPFGTVPYST